MLDTTTSNSATTHFEEDFTMPAATTTSISNQDMRVEDSMMEENTFDDDEVMLKAFLDETDCYHAVDINARSIDVDVDVNAGENASTDDAVVGPSRQVSDSTHGTHLTTTTAATTTTSTTSTTTTQQQQAQQPSVLDGESTVVHTELPAKTGRPSIQLYLSCNPDYLSEYQCAIRKNVELFEASEADIHSRIKGRNKPIVLGQVGIRCMHCSHVYPVETRERGSMYYPHALVGIYQAAQILSQQHLLESCPYVPAKTREEMILLKNKKSFATAGKEYWAETAKALGVYEDQYGLRFVERLSMVQYRGHGH